MSSQKTQQKLPDYYACVARDVVEMCGPREGVWVDLGCGEGPASVRLSELRRTGALEPRWALWPTAKGVARAER